MITEGELKYLKTVLSRDKKALSILERVSAVEQCCRHCSWEIDKGEHRHCVHYNDTIPESYMGCGCAGFIILDEQIPF